MAPELTHRRLLALFTYNRKTGKFTRRCTYRGTRDAVGWEEPDGYLWLMIDGCSYPQHTLAWFYVHGEWPGRLDHKNGKTADNRLTNLRPATQQQNTWNRVANDGRRLKGISQTSNGKWRARIVRDGVRHDLGLFGTADEAAEAYRQKAEALFGAFAVHLSRGMRPGKFSGKNQHNEAQASTTVVRSFPMKT